MPLGKIAAHTDPLDLESAGEHYRRAEAMCRQMGMGSWLEQAVGRAAAVRPELALRRTIGSWLLSAIPGGATMLRKKVISRPSAGPEPDFLEGEIAVADVATVQVTSEEADHPIDNAFDHRRGRGGSRWIAGAPGEQTVILQFDSPQTIRKIGVDVEELDVSRTQELSLSVSSDGGRTYRELLRQEFTFSPPTTSFERERWTVPGAAVTHLRLDIKPDKGGRVGRATLTSLTLA
jgi:hypothetical protein